MFMRSCIYLFESLLVHPSRSLESLFRLVLGLGVLETVERWEGGEECLWKTLVCRTGELVRLCCGELRRELGLDLCLEKKNTLLTC